MKNVACVVWLFTSVAVCSAAEAPTPAPGSIRIKFQAYDGDPKTPEKMEFQINPLNAGARINFLKIGEVIEGTKLRLVKFQFKEAKNASGEPEDDSELTVVDTVTGKQSVLILNRVVTIKAPAK